MTTYRVLCMQCGQLLVDGIRVPLEDAATLQATHTRLTEHRVVLTQWPSEEPTPRKGRA